MSLAPARRASARPAAPQESRSAKRIVQEAQVAEPKLMAARESRREVKRAPCRPAVQPAAIRAPGWCPGRRRASHRKSRRRRAKRQPPDQEATGHRYGASGRICPASPGCQGSWVLSPETGWSIAQPVAEPTARCATCSTLLSADPTKPCASGLRPAPARENGRDWDREVIAAAEALGLPLDVGDDGGKRRAFLRREQRRHPHGAGRSAATSACACGSGQSA